MVAMVLLSHKWCTGKLLRFCWQYQFLRHISSQPARVTPVFSHALRYRGRSAISDQNGVYFYEDLLQKSWQLASAIQNTLGIQSRQERVAFLCPNDVTYVITLWATWMSGHIAVPLSPTHPPSMLEYFVKDCDSRLIVATDDLAEKLKTISPPGEANFLILNKDWKNGARNSSRTNVESDGSCDAVRTQEDPLICVPDQFKGVVEDDSFFDTADALILYTSGSTGPPKGVLMSHSNLQAQTRSQISAWGWSAADVILHTLPLYHTHGLVNCLLCPLSVGARCVMLPKFDPVKVWAHLLAIDTPTSERVSLFMAVPTIYGKLLEEYEEKFTKSNRMREYVKAVCSKQIRLMVSGSAPLPIPMAERWKQITGHTLLERYGMTETGMILSNPLEGERKLGFVGQPMPGLQVRIAKIDQKGKHCTVLCEGNAKRTKVELPKEEVVGELLVQGPNVFCTYWRKDDATQEVFLPGGWFRTGDTAQYQDGSYKLLGRTSVDVLKSGGYKLSALHIETLLLAHPSITDCAVVGLPDPTWGQKVVAVLVLAPGVSLNVPELRTWAKERMASYMVPSEFHVWESLPRNAMGKVNKKDLTRVISSKSTKTE